MQTNDLIPAGYTQFHLVITNKLSNDINNTGEW